MHLFSICRTLLCVAAIATVSCAHADNVTFNYQGRVKVQGQPYNGTGQFKFSILNTSATATLWSHDGTVGQPATSIPIPVSDGIFSVTMGDSTAGMTPINGAIFHSTAPPKLRVWFDGGHGFQQLNPDHVLSDLTLNTVQTGLEDFTVYVNGTTGNDANNGLTPSTAKKTIQAAVDTLPDRIRCNVTVDVAAGVYREFVRVFGISVDPLKSFKIIGDKTWTYTSPGDPDVRITGVDSDVSMVKVRDTGLRIDNSSNITIEGILFNHVLGYGLELRNGNYKVNRCKATHGHAGIAATPLAYVEIKNCISNNNAAWGFAISRSSDAQMTNCVAKFNSLNGVFCHQSSYIQFFTYGEYSNNGEAGMNFGGYGSGSCWAPGTFHVKNNGTYGVTAGWYAGFGGGGLVQYSGNPSGNTFAFNSGSIY